MIIFIFKKIALRADGRQIAGAGQNWGWGDKVIDCHNWPGKRQNEPEIRVVERVGEGSIQAQLRKLT